MPRKKENKRTDGYYEVKTIIGYTYDEKPIYKSFYSSKSKSDARQKAEAYKLAQAGKQEQAEHISFKDYSAEYLERLQQRTRENTYRSVETVFRNHLVPYFGELDIGCIKRADLEKYISIKQKQYEHSYVKKQVRDFAACMNDAMYNGYINNTPCRNLQFKQDKKKEKRVYTPEQVQQVLTFCKQHTYGLRIHIMLSYGMSCSEFLAITLNDVDFENLTIHISKGAVPSAGAKMLVSAPKNQHRNRTIAISQETADWIKKECKHKYIANPTDNSVLQSRLFRKLYYDFMQAMREHYLLQGIDIPVLNPHELRHTRATIWVNENRNLFAIAEMLGWSDLSMLRKVYGHPDIQQLRKNLEI